MIASVGKIEGKRIDFFLLCLACLLNPLAHAVEPRPGEIYSGGSQIESYELGMHFSIPENWKGGLAPSGEVFLMEPQAGGALLFVIADMMSADQVYQDLQGSVEVPDLGQLVPRGEIKRTGNTFSGN